MTTLDEAEQKTNQFIEDTVASHWKDTKKAYMLSALGIELRNNVPESQDVMGEGLRHYLRQQELVNVVQYPNVAQKIGAVPLSADVPNDKRELFCAPKNRHPVRKKPVYKQQFWDSFINEIDEGKVRVVTPGFDGSLTIEDIALNDLDEKSDTYRIDASHITPKSPEKTIAEKAAATSILIERWLKAQGIEEPSLFLRSDTAISDRLRNLLDAFEGLSDEDMSRIEIPLDILSKLIRSK